MSADDVNFFFNMREQIKLYHWQTHSFAQHKATDELLDSLDKTIDEYVETYMGKYGRPKMTARNNTLRIQNMNAKMMLKFIKSCIAYLEGPLVKKLKPSDTDLVNLRDEMVGDLDKVLYLFTLS
jgi:DNA-binding ferritin-like protein